MKMAALGQMSFSLYFWLQYIGVQKTNASISSILVVGLAPLTTAIVAQFIGREALGAAKLGALVVGFAGVLLIVLQRHETAVSLDSGFLLGAMCLIANPFAWALNSTLTKKWMRGDRVSPVLMTGGSMFFGAIGLILISFTDPVTNHWADVTELNPARWGALLYLSLVCSVMGYFLYNFALTKITASQAAFYGYFEPVVAVSLGISVLGEQLTWYTFLGAMLIGSAATIMGRVGRDKGQKASEDALGANYGEAL